MLFSCFCPFVLSYPLADSASGLLLSLLLRCISALLPPISNWSWATFRLLTPFCLIFAHTFLKVSLLYLMTTS